MQRTYINMSHVAMQKKLLQLGIELDLETGHLFHSKTFEPLSLNFELVFIRHGETYGNCGQSTVDGMIDVKLVNQSLKNKDQRIYQGNVDSDINQLTGYGKEQANHVAELLNDDYILNNWIPDVILLSPLKRAQETAQPFVKQHQYEDRCVIFGPIKEMSFGTWENKRVCDISKDHPCHLFYQTQHALVKCNDDDSAENFCEVLLRARSVLEYLNRTQAGKKIIMFSHSMFGAACRILLEKEGLTFENESYLAFDGKRSDGSYYTISNATPYGFNVKLAKQFKPK